MLEVTRYESVQSMRRLNDGLMPWGCGSGKESRVEDLINPICRRSVDRV